MSVHWLDIAYIYVGDDQVVSLEFVVIADVTLCIYTEYGATYDIGRVFVEVIEVNLRDGGSDARGDVSRSESYEVWQREQTPHLFWFFSVKLEMIINRVEDGESRVVCGFYHNAIRDIVRPQHEAEGGEGAFHLRFPRAEAEHIEALVWL